MLSLYKIAEKMQKILVGIDFSKKKIRQQLDFTFFFVIGNNINHVDCVNQKILILL